MKDLSARTLNIAASLTVAIDTLAKQMIADGKDVVSLGAGEPDFPTPTPIQDAACKAIREGKTRYTAPVGILEVRKAVAEKLKVENGLDYKPEQIIMTSGAKHAVFNSLAALVNEGDEVIIPAPYWVTYPELVKWLGGKPVIVNTKIEDGFKIKARSLESGHYRKDQGHPLEQPLQPDGCRLQQG
jgi:aspartate aminotransferase